MILNLLKVSPNGRHFVDQDGKPFFYLADTCWLLFQRPTLEEIDVYLKDRAAKGFTVIQAYVIRGLGEKHPDGNVSLAPEPFLGRDPTKPNEKFFRHVDQVIARANELGLVMALVTAKSWHVQDGPEGVFNERNARTFGAFLGERYKNRAVLWLPGGDSAPDKANAVWVAMARGLKEGSQGRHLVSYHGDWSSSSSEWYHQADWLDFNTSQSGHTFDSDSVYFTSVDYALFPPKPTLDMEPSYENHMVGAGKPRIDSYKVRTQAYSSMLAGAAGHGYGAMDLFWFFKDADGPFPRGGGGWPDPAFQHWRAAMAYEGSTQMGLMRGFFEKRPWTKLVPAQSLIASYKGDGIHRRMAAKAGDGSFILAYLPEGGPVTMRGLDGLAGSALAAQWFDPRSGDWKKIGGYAKTVTLSFEAPSAGEKNDWVLVLDASD